MALSLDYQIMLLELSVFSPLACTVTGLEVPSGDVPPKKKMRESKDAQFKRYSQELRSGNGGESWR